MEHAIEKPSNKLLAVTDLDSDTWVGEVKRIRGKKLPLTAAPSALRFLLSQFQLFNTPARALAAETLNPKPAANAKTQRRKGQGDGEEETGLNLIALRVKAPSNRKSLRLCTFAPLRWFDWAFQVETGAHAQRPRQPGLRPDAGGD